MWNSYNSHTLLLLIFSTVNVDLRQYDIREGRVSYELEARPLGRHRKPRERRGFLYF